MWAILLRNPISVLLALMLHLGLAALVITGNSFYSPPVENILNQATIQAKVTDYASVKKQARVLAKLQAKQRATKLQAEKAAQLAHAAKIAEQQESERQKVIAREQAEALELAKTKRQAEFERQQKEIAMAIKREEEIQRQREQMSETVRLQLEFARQQQEAAEVRRQAEIKRQQEEAAIAAETKQQKDLQRQQAEIASLKQQEQLQQQEAEIKRQQAEAMAEALRQEEIDRSQLEHGNESNLRSHAEHGSDLDAEQQERDNYELATLQNKIYEQIRNAWRIPANSQSLRCTLRVNINLHGEVLDIKVINSSGNKLFDASTERAVRRAAPLPVPNNKRLFDEFLILEFDPVQN
jgi:colicin import membrane protein